MRILLTILLIIPTHIFAASNAETVNQIVAKYSTQCDAKQDAVEYGEVIPEAARLIVSDNSLYEIQITAEGEKATVLFADFSCPTIGASGWCGSSGCEVYIIVDGVSYQTRGWKPFTVTESEEVFVMLPRSGGACGRSNGSPCYRVTIWDADEVKFNTFGGFSGN